MARFWLIRHALVNEAARQVLYGTMDVTICPHTRSADLATYRALAKRLPAKAHWYTSPLIRTHETADAILAAGYPVRIPPAIEPGLIEQALGDWQGLPHDDLPARLAHPPHVFWPLSGHERPPGGGESIDDVIHRIGPTLERLAAQHENDDIVAISHGGTIRAAIAYAAGLTGNQILHFAIQNLSLSVIERFPSGWRVSVVNEITA